MPVLKPYTGPTKLVLAFDIGTIYSSASYCILQPLRVPEVLAVARFPAQEVAHRDIKIPSLLYYDNTGTVRAAGAEVMAQDVIERALTEGWAKAEWWKLHLCPKHLASSIHLNNDLPPLPSGKSAVDVLTDFIKYLFECCKTYIEECHPALIWSSVEDSIEYILTYPGGWAEQKHQYFRAIERAGLVPSIPEGQLRVHMLTEGEAGLHFYAQHLSVETTNRAARRGVVVIDAGGGIIDLGMFSMASNLISCEEAAPAESRLEGSIFVSRRARALIERKLEGWEHCNAENIARFTREFDETTKPLIESDRGPAYIKVAARRCNISRYCISSGHLKLSGDEVTGLFNDSVDTILRTFEQQQKFTATPITMAFLAGGFSTNELVWSRLRSYFMDRNIRIHRPDSHIHKVVAHGAVLSCVNHENHLECVARCTLPVKGIDEERIRRKTILRDCLSRYLSRLLMFARACNPRVWFLQMERNPGGFGVQTVCNQASLSVPKWIDQGRCELTIPGSFSPWSTIGADFGSSAKDRAPLSGTSALNTKCAEEEPGMEGKSGSEVTNVISMFRDAVDPIPHSHPDKPGQLDKIGSTYLTRYELFGALSGSEDVFLRQKVDSLTLGGHYLNNLGTSSTCFEHVGELSNLQGTISMLRDAVDLTHHGHPDKPGHLNNLSSFFGTRFECLGELGDLENAISTLRTTVDITPHAHPHKLFLLSDLGSSFFTRFERLGELGDLENAISTLRAAVDLIPHGHPNQPGLLNNLGTSFYARFECLGELSDLESAISMLRDVIGLTPHGHPDKLGYLSNLAASFITRFECLGRPSDLEHAISTYCHTASSPFGPIIIRFRASQKWISCAHRMRHHSLLHAYSVAIGLLPRLAWMGLPLTRRCSELKRGADVVRHAAAAALDFGLPETAVEWLEQGRSIIWGELFQLRSTYEELLSAHPDHARRLRKLSTALDHPGSARKKLLGLSEQTRNIPEPLQQEANKHRMLAIERDQLLREIRRFPGFERFLLQKELSQLRTSAHAGPVVILNAAESRCDALIVLANVDHVIHVPLPNFTFKQSADLQHKLKSFVCRLREGKRETQDGASWESFLSPLWRFVVKPVLQALAFSAPVNLSRIFWCPTGPFAFLPIHAAGFYDTEYSQPGHKVFDFVVSSYVPTLSILAPAPVAVPIGDLRFLVVRQPPSDGLSQLPGVVVELEHIRKVIVNSSSARVTLLESSAGTVEEILSLMMKADWVHFTCHGIQDPANPINSGLCLANGHRLNIRDIIGWSRPRGGLAFLSACKTATGDEGLSEEALHIAAGMLFTGYDGVIGTMWSISDSLAPVVAKHVYEYLFRNGTKPDYREASRALHEAIGSIREGAIASFDEWIPFIHVGL